MGGLLWHDKRATRRRVAERKKNEQDARNKEDLKKKEARKSPVRGRIPEGVLRKAYLEERKSMREIARACSCSPHKVAYWVTAYSIPVRSQSDALYNAWHKEGDPFISREHDVDVSNEVFLAGFGFGLYQAIGSKTGSAIRIGSHDPSVVHAFIRFLETVYGVHRDLFRFGLIVQKDADEELALSFWTGALSVSRRQFQKPTIARVGGKVARRRAATHGFVTLYFYNAKLKRMLCEVMRKRLQE